MVAVVTREVEDAFEKCDEFDKRGEVTAEELFDLGGEGGVRKPLCRCRTGEMVGVIVDVVSLSAPITGEAGGVSGRFASGEG